MKNTSKYLHPRDEIMQTMERIYRYRMTTTSGGNLSLREPGGTIWITPAGGDKGSLKREDIVCVMPNGIVRGRGKPSSELPFHQQIYEARPDIFGIVHAHAVSLVAFSITEQVPNMHLLHQSMNVCGEVGFARYALPGTTDLGRNVASLFKQGFDSVVLENHGVVVGGQDLQSAFQKFETLEFTAKTIIRARILGDVHYLTKEEIDLPTQIESLPEFDRRDISSLEKELRRDLCGFTRRGYQQRLFISTGGSFSVRLNADSFLITPYQVDRHTIGPDDIVLVQNGKCEAGKVPSRASRNHQAIYARHPSIGSILNAFPVNVTAFGVTRTRLNSRTIPESFLLLRDVRNNSYGRQFTHNQEIANSVSLESPIVMLDNDGVLIVGRSILEAFDRLEVLESTAESLIDGRLIGELTPLPDAAIDELTRMFLKKEDRQK